MSDSYFTLADSSEGFYKEKGSKFIGIAIPVVSLNQVKEEVEAIKKKYYDARHHCYAYIIGRNEKHVRANDDGEPNNSAGQPILGQIRSKELMNVLIVVVRYFGGTKLGVGGLVTAYKAAAADALAQGTIIEKYFTKCFRISFEYATTNEVMKVIKDFDLKMLSQDFGMSCQIEVEVRESLLDQVVPKLQDSGKLEEIE